MARRWTFGVCVLLAGIVSASAQDADLILYYDYEESKDGKIPDRSGKSHDGLIVGNVVVAGGGKFGKAGQFSNGGYLDLDGPNWPKEQIPRDGFSVLAWVNVQAGTDHAIFNARAKDQTWVIHPEVRNDGTFRWLLRANGSVTIFDMKAGAWKPNTWYHYAGVYQSGAGAILYIDGVKIIESPGDRLVAEDWGSGARVGKNIDDARPFTGLMDDLNVWKRGLTLAEVTSIMTNGPLPQAVDPQEKAASAWARLKSE